MNWLKKLFLAWWNVLKAGPKPKPSTGSTTPSDAPAAVDTTGPLVDPPAKYNDAYWADKKTQEREECGLEAEDKIIIRVFFIRGISGGAWVISSLARGHVRRGESGNDCDDWVQDGLSYHCKGGFNDEPQQPDKQPVDVKGNKGLPKWVVYEIRKAQ